MRSAAAAVLLVVGAALMGPVESGHAQLSPGPLSEAHRAQDSLFQCTSCHALGAGRAEFRCTDCHTEIRNRVAADRGYHARVVPADSGNESCASCHTEHVGRDFEIISWPGRKEDFDHAEAGYLLEGQHAVLGCDDCHTPENMQLQDRAGIIMDLGRSMLGLSTTCTSCHENAHRGEPATGCDRCHTLDGWTPASGFTHDRSRFPLTGLHSGTACAGCHSVDTEEVIQFTDIPFQTCDNCHADPHLGAFDAACSTCHDTTGWNAVVPSFGFDHRTTRFPLEGGHTGASCASCHRDTTFAEPVAHERCLDCHTDDHNGQFVMRDDGGDCGGCHTVTTFDTSTFTPERHDETRYPLVGMHQQVGCDACHAPALAGTDYHPTSESCLDCHVDTHDGQFSHLSEGACESCHAVDGFRPSTYTLTDHADSRFPLTGSHRAVVCFGCHVPISDDPDSGRIFRIEAIGCEDCHDDPHQTATAVAAQPTGVDGCDTCHDTGSWSLVPGFDHAVTRFPLLGAHRVATCQSCHQPTAAPQSPVIHFESAPDTCAGCHEDVHQGQFAGTSEQTDCERCHQAAGWSQIRFDHEEDSDFSLEGAHDVVPCTMCHVDGINDDGERVRVFAGTPTECAECH